MAILRAALGLIPFNDRLMGLDGFLSRPWQNYFSFIKDALDPLGIERTAPLLNNQSTPVNIEGLNFNSENISYAIVEFLIQRITTDTGATELIECGTLNAVFLPVTNEWMLFVVGTPGPDDSGIDFTITANGQVQYESSDITGEESISRFVYRVRTMAAKSSQYSKVRPVG